MFRIDNTTNQVTSHNIKKNICAILTLIFFCCVVLLTVLSAWLPSVVVVIGASFFLLATFVCAFKIEDYSQTEDYHVHINPTPLDIATMRTGLSSDEEIYAIDGSIIDSDSISCFVYSQESSKHLVLSPLAVDKTEVMYEFPEEIVPYVALLRDRRDKELSKYAALRPDKIVLGLRSDMSFCDDKITVNIVSRSATQVTDDSFNKIVVNQKLIKNKVVFNGRSLCLDEQGHLIPFSESKSANEIDIHTLIVSSDGFLMFRKGNKCHPLFAGKVISSASCSMTPDGLDTSRPFQDSLISELHRKIQNIYSIKLGSEDISSSLCGCARIIERGGAPEFYAITRLHLTKDEIVARHVDETACFIDGWAPTSLVPDLDGTINASDYIARAINIIRTSMSDDMSISAAALFTSIKKSMEDEQMSKKILQRIGIIPREEGYDRHSIGTAGESPILSKVEEQNVAEEQKN